LDPDFQGAALFSADAEGRFRFRTVKPGRYPGRVPHLHFAVSGGRQRVITQMYFPDEAGNQDDGVLKRIPAGPLRDRLIARFSSPISDDASIRVFQWDVVLAPG
jgi:protocatechuate 3,4-dioxygenase beta subunit